ncbi:MAG: DUF2892 domain-containing protein [Gammaproteobacteria bacterium]|nr:DUF2892 domain-containing protein [Gammaproteobacteria bacterium]
MDNTLWVNVALAERCLRAATALITVFYLLLAPGLPLFFALANLASLYLLLTALIAWDPLYALFYKVTQLLNIRSNDENRVLPSEYQLSI